MALQVWLPLTKDLRNQGLNNMTVTNHNATLNTAGKLGSCYYFNGSQQWLQLSGNLGDFYNNDWSVACWLKPTDSTRSVIISEYNGTGASNVAIELTASRVVRLYWNGSPDINFSTAGALPLNEWTHIVMTKAGRVVKLYFDGELKQTYTNSSDFNTRTSACQPRIGDDYRGNSGNSVSYQGYLNDFRMYDHCLSPMEVKQLARGLVLHYPLSDKFLEGTTNLVTSITSGGQTTWANNILTTSGTNADTYFTLNLSENIVNGTQYTISCDAEDIPQGTCWTFPLGQQGNTALSFQIYNGHNEYTFTANNISWGTKRCFMDDGGSPNSARATGAKCKIYNFQIEKKDHATGFAGYGGTRNFNTVYDCSGFCNNSILNTSATISTDTAKYTHSTYFGAYNTPKTDINDTSLLSALTNCSIAWWAKTDVAKTLFFTGQDGSHYVMASNNNNFYHQNAGSPTIYRDGIAGTYKNEAGVWHHYVMTGVNISSWTQFRINSYSSWPLNGLMSDVRIYATALSADDVKSLYQNCATIDPDGTIHGQIR